MNKNDSNRMLYFAYLLKIAIVSTICLNLIIPLFLHAEVNTINYQKNRSGDGHYPESGLLYLKGDNNERVPAVNLKTDVSMLISGLTARVKVVQTFKNDLDQWVEGRYLFPLPDKAAVDHLTIRIGERVIIGEIKERQAAKRIYEKAKISGKKASLVEQHRPNLFINSVANIGPYESIEVTIEYQQDVFYSRDTGLSIRFPMAITPRYQPSKIYKEVFDDSSRGLKHAVQSKFENIDKQHNPAENLAEIKIELDSGIPLQEITSTSHEIVTHQLTERFYKIALSKKNINADRDFALNWKPVASSAPRAAIFTERKAGENYLSAMILPPSVDTSQAKKIPREVIFVIDTSGSMAGESIKQAKKALYHAVSNLEVGDRFNVIQFNSVTQSLFSTARAVTENNRKLANHYIRNLKADGGTEMYPAIEKSLQVRTDQSILRQVIFLTDGAVSNEAELFELIHKNLSISRLYTVGIGSAPNAFFMKKAARFGRGKFTFISDIQNSSHKIKLLLDSISRPQLTHIALEWPKSLQVEMWPSKIPDLYDGEPLWLKVKTSQLKGNLRITGRLRDIAWQSDLSLNQPQQQDGIAVLWTREKIASIFNSAFQGKVTPEQKQQVIDTALEHHLVSRFTSLVAVEHLLSRATDRLHSEKIQPNRPKGSVSASKSNSTISYASTSLDLDLQVQWNLVLFALSLFGFLWFRLRI